MEDLIFIFKVFRFFLGLVIAIIGWVILNIVLTFFIKNDVIVLFISIFFVLITLFIYIKELIKE